MQISVGNLKGECINFLDACFSGLLKESHIDQSGNRYFSEPIRCQLNATFRAFSYTKPAVVDACPAVSC